MCPSSNVKNSGNFAAATEEAAPSEIMVASTKPSAALLADEMIQVVKDGPKRCGTCRKRVGLTGFNCRCGGIFCAVHRYTNRHECPFDYHKESQATIANANPVIKAEKLD